jgi:hypothetical protein
MFIRVSVRNHLLNLQAQCHAENQQQTHHDQADAQTPAADILAEGPDKKSSHGDAPRLTEVAILQVCSTNTASALIRVKATFFRGRHY